MADKSVCMSFDTHSLLPLLFGEHDKYLFFIEKKFGVCASSRGNIVHINGKDEAGVFAAKFILEELYSRLKQGGSIDMSEVEDVISMVKVKPDNYYATDSKKKEELSSLLQDDIVIKTIKKHIRPYTEGQKQYIKELCTKDVVFGVGPAGTGKTYLAVAVAVSKLLNHEIDRIILSRPAVEAGEKLGFLPGDMKDKVDPYLQPLYDALHDMIPAEKVSKFIENKVIEIAPLAFMRGRTLSNSFIILDEAQNVTPMQMKMFLTRLGEGSRMVISGDVTQIDLPKGETSGLTDAIQRLSEIEPIGIMRFKKQDVIRHPLTAKIIEAYS